MRLEIMVSTAIVLSAIQPTWATVAAYVIPSDQPVFDERSAIPEEVKALVSSPNRIFAIGEVWSGPDTSRSVFFRGSAANLNQMLVAYASMRGVHPGEGVASVVIRDDGMPEASYHMKVPQFDWGVRIVAQEKTSGPNAGKLENVIVYIDICVSDRISLGDLRIPPDLEIRWVSRLDKYADLHETARLGGREAMLAKRIRILEKELERSRRQHSLEGQLRQKPATKPAP